jgi:translation initiation factor IF-2
LPIRIYALAKQLKLDSKVLVDICTKAGVTGKGSALASLTDEEMATVTAFINAGRAGRQAAPAASSATSETAASPVFRREDYIPPGGSALRKIPVLPPSKPPLLRKKPEEPPAPPPVVSKPETLKEIAKGIERKTDEEIEKQREKELAAEREKQRALEAEKAREREKQKEKEREQRIKARERGKAEERERGPAIKLAPLPPSARLPVRRKSAEPAPQKPDIKLPLDAIRAGKAGTKPLSEHIRKHEQKRIAAEAAKTSPRKGAPAEGTPPETAQPASGRERPRRGGRPAPVQAEEEGPVTLGGREQRQLRRKKAASVRRRKTEEGEEETAVSARKRTHIRRTGANTAAPRRESVCIELPCTVRSFSEAIGVPARNILAKLLELGTMSNIAASLDAEMAELLAVELGIQATFHQAVTLEQQVLQSLEAPDDPAKLLPRPPIVTFLGHVDHGKTSLLDRIIGIDVAAHEKGGITQHIRAYRVERNGRAIAFVDTPGHEAFTAMRARGANVTDIAVLVVAAEDGVMPQTEEAISHARAAEVPIVVALNKIDLPGANAQRAYEQLAASELLPSEWGGETEVVKTSAVTGEGIDSLLETLLTVAELHEYKADPDRPARGTCLEAELHEERGVVAKLLVQGGTLHLGDVVVCGSSYGRVKAMYDTLELRRKHKEAGPSTPVNVTGLNCAPAAGDRFYVLPDITKARELADQRAAAMRQRELGHFQPHVTLETLYERLGQESKVQTLNIILRADVRGSIEAIRKELQKLDHPEVQIRILQATVGGITEADVHLAHASDAIIIGFSVVPDEGARMLADKLGVQIRRYDIIYQVTDDLKAALEGMLKPEQQEKELGRAFVQQVFHISHIGVVAGCRVLAGIIARDARIRVIRDSRIIGDYAIDSLKREKDDAREVREGFECGIKLAGFNDVKQGDVLEAYKIEEIARTL